MVKVRYDYRIVCDRFFIEWLSEQGNDRASIFSNLMHIKSSSSDNKKNHNVILNSEAEYCVEKKFIQSKEKIGKAFKVIEDPEFLNDHAGVTRNIFFTIDLTDEPPFKCYIFTSPEKEEEYKSNPHYVPVKSVSVKAGHDAVNVINCFFTSFYLKREQERNYIIS